MKDQKLLASIAVFRELYDKNQDVYDVITSFIRSAMISESTWALNATQCTALLRDTYGFELPDAVVKTCLRKRLKSAGELDLKNGLFTITEKFDKTNTLIGHENAVKEYQEIITSLIESIRTHSQKEIDTERSVVEKCFNEYILNQNYRNEYSNEISRFLIAKNNDSEFNKSLRKIEEGLILYTGIKYTAGINELGSWNNDMIIFLDTELLFSAAGLNGDLYKKLFDDFHNLVEDANHSRNKNGKIKLSYFAEADSEIESFFYAAMKIIESKANFDHSKTAMAIIINNSKSRSDIITKKIQFQEMLRKLKITKEDEINYYENPEFNLESRDTVEKLKTKFNHHEEEDEYFKMLRLFTKINVLRKGNSSVGIDKVKAVMLTAKRLTLQSAQSDVLKKEQRDIPFATHIDFMTERLWFKLNKGFGGNKNTPVSFSAVTKAKLALASKISSKISDDYKKLQEDLNKGSMTIETAALLNSQLRANSSKPEDLDDHTVDAALTFISTDIIEKAHREQFILEEKSKQGDIYYQHFKKLIKNEREKSKHKIKRRTVLKCKLKIISIYVTLFAFLAIAVFILKEASDTILGIISVLIAIIATLSCPAAVLIKYLKKQCSKNYHKELRNEYDRIDRELKPSQ